MSTSLTPAAKTATMPARTASPAGRGSIVAQFHVRQGSTDQLDGTSSNLETVSIAADADAVDGPHAVLSGLSPPGGNANGDEFKPPAVSTTPRGSFQNAQNGSANASDAPNCSEPVRILYLVVTHSHYCTVL